jgi:TonB family protein
MHVTKRLFVIVSSAALTVSSCGTPPTADLDAARASLEKATAERAGQFASESLKAAQAAQAALDAELKTQEGNWFKSYDRARELAVAAMAAADKAAADAASARKRAETAAAAERAAAEARAKVKKEALKVGGSVRQPVKIKDVAPVYPAIARSNKIGGTVVIEATIGADGKVIDAQVIKSVPVLDQAALDAVRQWVYTPTLLNGKPVPVNITVTVDFKP